MLPTPSVPSRKVNIGLAAGAFMTLVAWVTSLNGIVIPAEVALAGSTLIVFVLQYIIPDAIQE